MRGSSRPQREISRGSAPAIGAPNKRLHLTPRLGAGVGHFVTRGCSVRSNQKRFQNNSRFAAQVSREPLGGDSDDIAMKTTIHILVLAWFATALGSCVPHGVSKSQLTTDPCASIAASNLPDLEIANIVYRPHLSPPEELGRTKVLINPNLPPPDPIEWVAFEVIFKNVGSVEFHGAVWLKLSGDTVDMQTGRFPIGGELKECILAPKDSARIGYDRPRSWLNSGTTVRFVLLTDADPYHVENPEMYFGTRPVCEASRTNNSADLVVK